MSKITRKDIKSALKEFDGQKHDCIDVHYTTNQTASETHRLSVFGYLEDKGFVVLKNQRNFLDGYGLPPDGQDRLITHEKVYRITALGRNFSRSFIFKAFQNVIGNIPTIVIAVGIGVAINLLSALFQKRIDSQHIPPPTLGQEDTSLPTVSQPAHKRPPVPASQ